MLSPGGELRVIPVKGLPEMREGDDVAALIAAAAELEDGDVLVVAHKVVSKAEGRVVKLSDVAPGEREIGRASCRERV